MTRIEDLTELQPSAGDATTTYVGVDRPASDLSYKVSLQSVIDLVPTTSVPTEVTTQTSNPSGIAPAGAALGLNSSTGELFFVNAAGVYDQVPASSNLTEGTMSVASENRVANFGGKDLDLIGIDDAALTAITSIDLTAPLVQLSSSTIEARGNQSSFRFYDGSDSSYTALRGPATGAGISLTLPSALPTSTKYLVASSSGEMDFVDLPLDSTFKGVFSTLSALQSAHSSASSGDWALLSNPSGASQFAVWDADASPSADWVAVSDSASLPSTNLGATNNTSTSIDVTSSTGTGVTLGSATTSQSGLLSAADKASIDAIANIVSGDLPSAAENRDVNMGSKQLRILSTNQFAVSDISGSAIQINPDIVLTSSNQIQLNAPTVEAIGSTVQASTIEIKNSTDVHSVSLESPSGLAASQTVEWLDLLPTPSEVSSDSNYLSINDSGKITLKSASSSASPVWSEVATKDDRPSGVVVGYRAKVLTHLLTYIWDGTDWEVDDFTLRVTASQWSGLSEVEDGQVALITDLEVGWAKYSTANGWQGVI